MKIDEPSDGPKRGIGRFLMENLLAPARSSGTLFVRSMVGPNLATYGMESLETKAHVLNAICEPNPTATPFYEIMSDALIWSDEKHLSLTSELIFALRQLWRFRTLCILQNKRMENEVVDQCILLFPNWIGFLPERWLQTPEALAEYRRGDVSLRWCLHNIDIDEKKTNNDGLQTKPSIIRFDLR